MAYLGKTPSQAVRQRYIFTASAGDTSISGADDNGNTLTYTDGAYADVYLNGVLLVAGTDYNTSTANTIGGLSALSEDDVVEIVVYDTFAVFGGEVQGDLEITNGALKTTDITAVDSNGIQFNTDEGTERARINDSGHLLVGKTSSALNTVGAELRSVGTVTGTRDSGEAAQFQRRTDNGAIVVLKKDGSTVGSIESKNGDSTGINLYPAGNIGVRGVPSAVIPFGNGSDRDATTDLGRVAHRFRNGYFSGGVYLGGTGSANYLDDYEEGTWTPTLEGATSGSASFSAVNGAYVKIGRFVHCMGMMNISSVSGVSGTALIKGLPFAIADILADTGNDGVGTMANFNALDINVSSVIVQVNQGSNAFEVRYWPAAGAGGTTNLDGSDLDTGSCRFDLRYYTTA